MTQTVAVWMGYTEVSRIIQSRFDEICLHKSSFVVLFPFLDKVVRVDVGSDILSACATHNYIAIITDKYIYLCCKDELESPLRCSYKLEGHLSLEFEPQNWESINVSNENVRFKKYWSKNKEEPTSNVILTSTVSTMYLVYTVDGVSTVVRLFNEYNYLDSETVSPVVVQIPEDVRIISAASGNDHSLFLTDKGAVYALGTGSRGELGIGLVPRVCELTWIEALEGVHVTSIAAAGWHSAALTAEGDVYVWGWNHRGQLGAEKEKVEFYPLPLEIDLRVVRMDLRDHLTALWVAEDGDEPSIVMGTTEIGMPTFRLQYFDQIPDKKSDLKLAEDSQVDMVFPNDQDLKLQDCSIQREAGDQFEYFVRDKD